MFPCASSSRQCFRILSSPLERISRDWCLPLIALHVMNMSHLGQRGRGCPPPSRITTVSCTWRCVKFTQDALRLVILPGHTPIRKMMLFSDHKKDIQKVLDSSGGWGPSDPPRPPCTVPICGTPRTLPPGLCCNGGNGLFGGVIPGKFFLYLSSGVCRPLQNNPQARGMAGKPCSPSWPRWCAGQHSQTTPSGWPGGI